ncbi:MAG: hypothetical protein GY809_18270 [Planctomycetes bacterium]|nr:hypothetical protein [Planctomycetota bacterium]
MFRKSLISLVVVLGLIGSASATLNYEYYEAPEGTQYSALADVNFGEAEPNMIGTSDTLDSGNGSWIEQADGHRGEDFAFRFFGEIVVPISGDITFYLRSDDGSQIFIDGEMVVDNDGLHGTEGFPGDPGVITLEAGAHTIEATMFERGGGDSLHVAWSAGGQPAVRVPDSVLFLEATADDIAGVGADVLVIQNAYNPTPADGAIELVDADVALISWEPGFGAISYNVYISADPEVGDDDLAGSVTEPNYAVTDALVPGATYYWRVDAMDIGLNTYTGDVWQLTALDILAHFPSPADGAVWQAGDTQPSFTAGLGAAVHHIYFSTDKALVDARDASVATMFSLLTTINYGDLDAATTYYWAVDEFVVPDTVAGPTWSFTTLDPVIAANVESWNAVAAGAAPAYLATHVADGVYDIGAYTGDQTYEFVVVSDPCETQASMALIGRRSFGDTTAGIKYEQWNNTGTYGATIFGVVDLDFGVATAPGAYTHLAFVSDANSTTLFVNGVEEGVVTEPISLSGLVGIGHAISAEDGSGSFDNFDGSVFGVAIYDEALSGAAIEKNAAAFFNPIAISDPNLVVHFTFENVENGIVPDASGHSNFGVEIGGPTYVGGIDGQAISLDGTTQCVDLGLNDAFNPTGSFTIAVWANAASWGNGWGHAMMGNRGEGGIGWQLRKFGGNPTVSFTTRGIGDDDNPESTVDMPLNQWVQITAVYDNASDTKTLYFNGDVVGTSVTNPGSVNPTTHNTYVGARASGGNTPEAFFDGLLDDVRFYDKALTGADVAALVLGISDITGPDDAIVGDPNDGDWPGGEYPALAIDDDVTTKFLHFGGETGPTGFEVEPAMGATIVQGLALTTANDSPNRDPASFELYGSNDSIDGPFELIASGDIVDFTQVDAYPRFTKNATAITFDNTVSYTYYRILFPTIRDAANANSMQIAEVELLGAPAVMWTDSITIGGDVEGDAQLVGDGVYEITGSGADVWGTSDQFHYLYKDLTGDGSISCRVTDFGTGSNSWAKGGVMIRETLDADSKHAIMVMTGGSGGGISFQGRTTEAGASSSGMHSDITAAPPQWVKLTREGNTFTAYYSADGVAWELFTDETPSDGHSNPMDIEMAESVTIGLFVTSHAAGELRTYTIDNVSIE